jgi:hypothetical protein
LIRVALPETRLDVAVGSSALSVVECLRDRRYERLMGWFRNFSRNRPEMTILNHQYAMRRVVIGVVLDAGTSSPGFRRD